MWNFFGFFPQYNDGSLHRYKMKYVLLINNNKSYYLEWNEWNKLKIYFVLNLVEKSKMTEDLK
jgi:hypothetical protein